jgi:hypothetical protein
MVPSAHRHSVVTLVAAVACGLLPQGTPAQYSRTDAQALHRALDDLKAALDERWSYRHFNDADFDGAIGALRKKVDAGISSDDFGIELQKIIALGIDGHARISGYELPGAGPLPFLVEAEGERVVAVNPARVIPRAWSTSPPTGCTAPTRRTTWRKTIPCTAPTPACGRARSAA